MGPPAPRPWAPGGKRGEEGGGPGSRAAVLSPAAPRASHTGISSPVKKTEVDKSPFNSPSPQDSPRLSSFTQHHRPVIAVHSGIARSPHPSSTLHFPTTSILPQTASTYFPHTAIRYPPHLNPQDPLKDLVSLACDPASQQPGPINGSGQLKMSSHCLSAQMLAPTARGELLVPPAWGGLEPHLGSEGETLKKVVGGRTRWRGAA
ncbi:nuclear factor 1 C-type-like [Pteropus medius]|uniref:nuclear factor 1 C-type-like n=1 Tax=Pteropus vampyrus TaxID=132908 RepID=UPI00196ACBB7|nr:nuclear factor 1 C-type-like [Pteropus giganteus]